MKLNWHLGLFSLVAMSFLSTLVACQPTVEEAVQTTITIPPAPSLEANTPALVATEELPLPPTSEAITSPADPLAGLRFSNQEGVWQVASDGSFEQISTHNNLKLSPSAQYGVYADHTNDYHLMLWERPTGTETQLSLGNYARLASWGWLNDTQLLVLGQNSMEGWGGTLNLYDITTHELTLIDEQLSLFEPVQQPNGSLLAYAVSDAASSHSMLYDLESGEKTVFDTSVYAGWSYENVTVGSPTWSPDGTKLAWVVAGFHVGGFEGGDDWGIETAIFDLSTQTVSFVNGYLVLGGSDGYPAGGQWSPSGQWIANQRHERKQGILFASVDGTQTYHLGQDTFLQFVGWHPTQDYFVITQFNGVGDTENYRVEPGVWELTPLELPAGSTVLGW